MSNERPLAFVVQRYGEDIVGGSEALCRKVAEMLSPYHSVEVLTSCARDYMTWRNEYRTGSAHLGGVRVRRFPVDFERDHRFYEIMGTILAGMPLSAYQQHQTLMRQLIGRSTTEQQLACLRLEGPYSTPLLEYLSAHHQDYSRIVFFTYLYPTTFFGSQRVPASKTVLVPTAHDEAPIFFPIFRQMFERFPAFIFLSPEERAFIEGTFAVEKAHKTTIGMPVELAGMPDAARFQAKYHIDQPFLLYAGRIDPSKGCDRLLAYHRAIRHDLSIPLILIGNRVMELPRDPHVRYLGMLPEQDKLDAMAAATVLINPSSFESFSIVVLEAMLCGTPVLVNGQCEVLKGHVQRSRGGLYYETVYEFVEALKLLVADETLRVRMGTNGAAYVRQNYARQAVKEAYVDFLGVKP
jgi:glycosyltransferase involved in cell wall biosynthesis